MIILVVIGILAGLAYPTYTEFVRRGQRAECRAALSAALQAQERYYTTNTTYTTDLGVAGYKTYSGDNAAVSACTLSAAACGTGITACVAVTSQTQKGDPDCPTYTLDTTNTRNTVATKCLR